MSVTAVLVVLGALVVASLRYRAVRPGVALLCATFGFVLAMTPAAPPVERALDASGAWVWSSLRDL